MLPVAEQTGHREPVAPLRVEGLRPVRWVRVAGGGKLEPSCKRPVRGRRRGPGQIDWRTSCPSQDWWTSPAVRVHLQQHLGTGRAARRETKGCATRPIRRRSRRSSPSCASAGRRPYGHAAPRADRRSCGAPGCGSARRSRSPRPIWTATTRRRCSSAAARAASAARSGWTTGRGSSSRPGSSIASQLPGRPVVLHHRRPDRGRAWSPAPRARAAAPTAPQAGRAAAVRAAPAPPRARVEMAHEGIPLPSSSASSGTRTSGSPRMGRAGARCRRCRRSVSPPRPPNRTCPFLSIRLSTGHAMADRGAG